MRTIVASLLFFTCWTPSYAADPVPTVRVVFFNNPPHITVDKNYQPTGPLVFMWNKMADYGNFHIKWIGPVPLIRIIKMMPSGKLGDAIAQLAPSDERIKLFDFSAPSICDLHPVLIVNRTENKTDIKALGQPGQNRIATISGTPLPKFMQEKRNKLSIVYLAGEHAPDQAIKMLLLQHVWGVYSVAGEVVQYWAAAEGNMEKIKTIAIPESSKVSCNPAMWKGLDNKIKARIIIGANKVNRSYGEKYKALMDKFIAENVDPAHRVLPPEISRPLK